MADQDTSVKISGDHSGAEAALQRVASAASDSAKSIEKSYKSVASAIEDVNKRMNTLIGVIAGGSAFKKLISDGNEWNATAGRMALQLGVTTQQASVLNVALARLGIDSDTYTSASQKLSKQIFSNGQAFEVLGVKVRDTTTGAYRPVIEVMGEVNRKLLEIRNPIEQNIAGQQVYGKGWQEVRGILRLTAEQMQQAETRARQLGLIVGPEGVAMSKQYSQQMRDLQLVGKSLEVQFGTALLPVFTRLGSFMSGEGPKAAETFANMIRVVGFGAASTWLALKDMGDGIAAAIAQIKALATLDIAGARAITRARNEQAAENEATYEKLKKALFETPPAVQMPKGPDLGSGPQYHFKEKADGAPAEKSRLPQWEADLAEQKAVLERGYMMQGQYRQMTRGEELSFWTEMKARKDLTETEKLAISRKASESELAMIRDGFDVQVRTLEAQAAAYRNNTDERLRLEREIQSKYMAGTVEYERAQKRIEEIQRQAAEQTKAVAQERANAERTALLAGLDMRERAAQADMQLGLIDQRQLLQQQQQFEELRYQIAAAALQERLRLAEQDPDRNPVEYARLKGEIEQLEMQHQSKLQQIRLAMRSDDMGPLVNTFQAAEQSIAKAINGMLSRTMTLRQGLAAAWQGISQSIIGEISKILAKKVAAWGVEKALALAGISANAAEAGSGAAAAEASIPYVGPILAIAAMAAVFAAVSGMSSNVQAPSASAAGGFDIPSFSSPLVQTHAQEMILPATLANTVRDMAIVYAQSRGADAPSGPAPVIQVSGVSVGDWAMVNRRELADAMARANKDRLRRG